MTPPFCHNYTHPTIALILRELAVRPRTIIELGKILRIGEVQARDALNWMRGRHPALVRILVWRKNKNNYERVWALKEGKPDAAKPTNKRKEHAEARALRMDCKIWPQCSCIFRGNAKAHCSGLARHMPP